MILPYLIGGFSPSKIRRIISQQSNKVERMIQINTNDMKHSINETQTQTRTHERTHIFVTNDSIKSYRLNLYDKGQSFKLFLLNKNQMGKNVIFLFH